MSNLDRLISLMEQHKQQHQEENPGFPKYFRFYQQNESLTFVALTDDFNPVFVLHDTTGGMPFGTPIIIKQFMLSEAHQISQDQAMENVTKQDMATFLNEQLGDLEPEPSDDDEGIDWTSNETKYTIGYNYSTGKAELVAATHLRIAGATYIANLKAAQKAVDSVNSQLSTHH